MATNAFQRDDDVDRPLQIQSEVSAALAGAATITEAAPGLLTALAHHFGWSVGVFWLVDEADDTLCPAAVLGNELTHADLLRITRAQRLARGEGLPGRAWASAAPEWTAEIGDARALPRQQAAHRAGLRSGIAFPVAVDARVVAVLEFFSPRVEHPEETVVRTLSGVGQQVGQFMARTAQRERALGSHAEWAAVLATSLEPFLMIDERGRVLEWNAAAEQTFGWSRDEAVGRRLETLIIPPAMRAAHAHGFARYLATGEAHIIDRRLETEAVRRDGTTIPVELAVTRVPLAGAPLFAGHLRDLSEPRRVAAEQRMLTEAGALLGSSLDYETTLRNLGAVVIPAFADWFAVDVVDAQQQLVRLTVMHRDPAKLDAARALQARYPERSESEYGAAAVVRSGVPQLVRDITDEVIRGATQGEEHERLVRTLGLCSLMIVPMRTTERLVGAITFVTAESRRHYDHRDLALAEELGRRGGQAIENARLFQELTEARQTLEEQATELEAQAAELQNGAAELEGTIEELQEANEELVKRTHEAERARAEAESARLDAVQANRAKSDFLATMSHELRTPLNAIVGYAQLLEVGVHGTLAPQQRTDLERINRSAHHLLGLINDLLNFAKLEAGHIQLHPKPVEVAHVLAEVEDLVRPQSREKRLAYHLENRCPGATVSADRDKLTQIFVNLLTNAIRFTPDGGRIDVVCTADEGAVTTEVRDTGVGIPADKLEEIFEPFVQLGLQYPGERQGTGLGLAITRELARAMGGEVTARSTVGVGSTFTVRLKRG